MKLEYWLLCIDGSFNVLNDWQVGGVHSHLINRVQRDLERINRPLPTQEIMRTVFPMFQQYIEPDLVHAHVL